MNESIGEHLRSVRKKLNKTIDEMAAETKIQKRYLESLENDNYDELPGETYVRGFLRSYCDALKIDSSEILAKYKNFKNKTITETKTGDDEIKKESRKSMDPKTKELIRNAVAAFIVLLAFYLFVNAAGFIYKKVFNGSAAKNEKIPEAKAENTEKAGLPEILTKAAIENKSSNEIIKKESAVKPSSDALKKETAKKIEKKAEQKKAEEKKKNIEKIEEKAVKAIEKNEAEKEALAAEENNAADAGEIKNLKIEATGTSWLQVYDGDELIFKGNVNEGVVKNIKTTKKIRVVVGDASNIKMEYDGKDLGVLGRAKQVVKKEF